MTALVVTRGYGTGTLTGAINEIAVRGYNPSDEPPPVDKEWGGGFGVEYAKRKFENPRREIEQAVRKATVRDVEKRIDEEFVEITPEIFVPMASYPILDPRLFVQNPEEQDEEDMLAMLKALVEMGEI